MYFIGNQPYYPFGAWPAKAAIAHPDWVATGDQRLCHDFALLKMGVNQNNRNIGSYTGRLQFQVLLSNLSNNLLLLQWNFHFAANAQVIPVGYPAAPPFDGTAMYFSNSRVSRWETKGCAYKINPTALTQGSSGGPMIVNINNVVYPPSWRWHITLDDVKIRSWRYFQEVHWNIRHGKFLFGDIQQPILRQVPSRLEICVPQCSCFHLRWMLFRSHFECCCFSSCYFCMYSRYFR